MAKRKARGKVKKDAPPKAAEPKGREKPQGEKGEARAVVVRQPAREPARLFREMDRLFEDVMRPPWLPGPRWWPERLGLGRWPFAEIEAAPALDVYEEKDAVVVKAELPGLGKDDIEVSLSGDLLTVRGEKRREEEIEEEDYYRRERSYGAFSRSVRLPAEVEVEKATSTFKKGVLEIRLPKTEGARRRTIPIKGG
jgi:HSP20 family protein